MPQIITLGETMAVMVPGEPGPLKYASGFRLRMAGAESNTAVGVAKLGLTAGWISALGADALGDYMLYAIRAEGVDVSGVKTDTAHRTGMMLKEFSARETSVYYYRENSAASHYDAADLPLSLLQDARIVHLTGITPVLSESCRRAAEYLQDYAKRTGKMLYLLPADEFETHPEWFRMTEEGERTPDFNLCASNEEALDYFAEQAAALAKKLYRNSDRYFLWLDDVKNSSCHCPQCQKLTPSDQ